MDTNLFFEYNFLPRIRVFLGLPMRILHELFAKKVRLDRIFPAAPA